MTELICEWCLCLALAMQSGGNCHQCTDGTKEQLTAAVKALDSKMEFIAAACYPKNDPPMVGIFKKQGSIVPWK